MYTETEVSFLLESRSVPEFRNGIRGFREFKQLADFRVLGGRNVLPVFESMLNRRAAALGNIFREFRATLKVFANATAPAPVTLESEIESQKLF